MQILMVMRSSKNLCVFNFKILLKSRKFVACKIYIFYIHIHGVRLPLLFTSLTLIFVGDQCPSYTYYVGVNNLPSITVQQCPVGS